jgi:hypothetical protein
MHRTVALTLGLTLTACARVPTDPAPALTWPPRPAAQLANPTATFNQLLAISAVTNNPVFESFTVLAPRFGATGAQSLALGSLPLELAARYSPWHRRLPLTTYRALPSVRRAKRWWQDSQTFVWDPSTNSYVASSEPGAPPKGDRFVLYAISGRTGLPSVPLAPIGYVDLTRSSPGAVDVTLVGTPATGPSTTYASYRVAGEGSGGLARGASVVQLAGFVTDGITRLDITVRIDSTTTPGTLSVETALAVAGEDLRVDESVTLASQGGDRARMTTDLQVASGGELVRAMGDVTLDTTTHIGSGTMTVSVDDSAFATITLGGPDLVFAAAPGVALTTADETTLRALFSTSFELFGTVRVLSTSPSSFIPKRPALSS